MKRAKLRHVESPRQEQPSSWVDPIAEPSESIGADRWIEDPSNAWGVAARSAPPRPKPGAVSGSESPVSPSGGVAGSAPPSAETRPERRPEPPSHDAAATAVLDLRTLRRAPNRRAIVTEAPSNEMPYPPVLGFTGIWYAIPGLLYMIWLTTLDSERQTYEWRALIANLPWLLAAVASSLLTAVLLRRVVIGWRALTISFAAAVIGSGLTTMVHSLSA